jgi:hypothetical protein
LSWLTWTLLGFLSGIGVGLPILSRRLREYRLSQAGLDKLGHMTDEDMLRHMGRLLGALGYRVFRPTWEDAGFQLVLIDGLGQKRGVLLSHWRRAVDEPVVQQAVEAAERLESTAPMIVTVEYYTFKAREAADKAGVILWSVPELTQAIGRVKQAAVAYPEIPAIRSAAMARAEAAIAGLAEASGPEEALATLTEPLTAPTGRTGSFPAGPAQPRPARGPDLWSESLVPDEPEPGSERGTRKAAWWKPRARTQAAGSRDLSSLPPADEVPKCPRCSQKMVMRKSSKGEYWGCPNFPKCLGSRPKL